MTYCCALRLDSGMIFASDSRTNAGVDHIATFSKMRVYEKKDDRVIVVLSSGNLAGTQTVISLLKQRSEVDGAPGNVYSARTMFDVVLGVSDVMRSVEERDGKHLEKSDIAFNASLIVGGQLRGEPMRLFRIYAEGNFIEAGDDTPFLQTGEAKYGKPIIDRVITGRSTSLRDAMKCVLVSFDSTMKSNISVGLPIDLLWYPRDSLRVGLQHRIREGDPYFTMLRSRWGGGLRRVFSELPDPDWLE